MQRVLIVVTLVLLSTLIGCGGECPEASSTGQCALSGLSQNSTARTTTLKLGSCSRVPVEVCDGAPGLSCVSYRAPQDWYGYSAMLITSAEGWAHLKSKWKSAELCVPGPPTDWTGTTLVLADIWATGSTMSRASLDLLASPDGTPHLSFQLDFNSCSDCDCLSSDMVGLVVRSTRKPTVCMNAVPSC